MNSRFHSANDVGMLCEIGDSAVDFRRPDEANRAARSLKLATPDQCSERARDFEYRRRARSVVVGSRFLVAQVTGKNYLLIGKIRAGNSRGHDFVVARLHLCFHDGVKRDLLIALKSLAILARATKRRARRAMAG